MLKLRSIGLTDYRVLKGRQSIGRIRLAEERMPPIWLWTVNIHLTGGLPKGSAKDLDTAKAQGDRAEPRAEWKTTRLSNATRRSRRRRL
jgi:hypothetical protein